MFHISIAIQNNQTNSNQISSGYSFPAYRIFEKNIKSNLNCLYISFKSDNQNSTHSSKILLLLVYKIHIFVSFSATYKYMYKQMCTYQEPDGFSLIFTIQLHTHIKN